MMFLDHGERDQIGSSSKIFFVSLSYASVAFLLLCHQVLALSDASSSPAMGTSSRVARAAIAQLCSTRDKQSNLINIAKCAGWAQREQAQMLFLPECLGFMGDNADHTLEQADPALTCNDLEPLLESLPTNPFRRSLADVIISHAKSPGYELINDTHCNAAKSDDEPIVSIIDELRFIARESGLWISGGGVHTQTDTASNNKNNDGQEKKIHNTHVIIDNKGQIKCYYHKIHLFDVSIPNQVNLLESKTTAPGSKLVVCDSPIGKLGVTICYDMRFSEMYVDLVQKGGAEVLLVPSAFTVPTGKAHWHALLRARAIENQCYVIAAAQMGKHNEKRESYGHSLAYDPWGSILCDAGGYDGFGNVGSSDSSPATLSGGNIATPLRVPGIVLCEVDLDKLASVRERMPIQQHRENSSFSF